MKLLPAFIFCSVASATFNNGINLRKKPNLRHISSPAGRSRMEMPRQLTNEPPAHCPSTQGQYVDPSAPMAGFTINVKNDASYDDWKGSAGNHEFFNTTNECNTDHPLFLARMFESGQDPAKRTLSCVFGHYDCATFSLQVLVIGLLHDGSQYQNSWDQSWFKIGKGSQETRTDSQVICGDESCSWIEAWEASYTIPEGDRICTGAEFHIQRTNDGTSGVSETSSSGRQDFNMVLDLSCPGCPGGQADECAQPADSCTTVSCNTDFECIYEDARDGIYCPCNDHFPCPDLNCGSGPNSEVCTDPDGDNDLDCTCPSETGSCLTDDPNSCQPPPGDNECYEGGDCADDDGDGTGTCTGYTPTGDDHMCQTTSTSGECFEPNQFCIEDAAGVFHCEDRPKTGGNCTSPEVPDGGDAECYIGMCGNGICEAIPQEGAPCSQFVTPAGLSSECLKGYCRADTANPEIIMCEPEPVAENEPCNVDVDCDDGTGVVLSCSLPGSRGACHRGDKCSSVGVCQENLLKLEGDSGFTCGPTPKCCEEQATCADSSSPDFVCPDNPLLDSSHICRPVCTDGDCSFDVEEICTGSSPDCPLDTVFEHHMCFYAGNPKNFDPSRHVGDLALVVVENEDGLLQFCWEINMIEEFNEQHGQVTINTDGIELGSAPGQLDGSGAHLIQCTEPFGTMECEESDPVSSTAVTFAFHFAMTSGETAWAIDCEEGSDGISVPVTNRNDPELVSQHFTNRKGARQGWGMYHTWKPCCGECADCNDIVVDGPGGDDPNTENCSWSSSCLDGTFEGVTSCTGGDEMTCTCSPVPI